MQQLSGTDSTFLYAEHGNMFNHVSSLSIYDPSTHPEHHLRFKDILAHFEQRLDSNPVFRRRLVEVPLGMDRPYWVQDVEVDVEFHVRHIALPDPGDWRQLMIQVARLHSRPLDRRRPLWEVYVIDRLDNIPGIPSGCFATFSKFHHASVDGMAALHLMATLHSDSPALVNPATLSRIRLQEREPLALEMTLRAATHSTERMFSLARLTAKTLGRAAKQLSAGSSKGGDTFLSSLKNAPTTRFSADLSAHRVVEGLGLPMAAIKTLRAKVPGITINDVFLALVSGTMRSYLQAKGELPDRSLNALMPISLRTDATAGGNDVTGVPVSLATHLADPIERLHAAQQAAKKSVRDAEVLGLDLVKQLLDNAPTALADALLNRMILPQINTTVSNVRGPDKPLYLAGARLLRIYPISIPAHKAGINHTAVSYDGYFWIGIVSCREMLPDPAFYMECMRTNFNDMLKAAGLPPVEDIAFANETITPVPRKKKGKVASIR